MLASNQQPSDDSSAVEYTGTQQTAAKRRTGSGALSARAGRPSYSELTAEIERQQRELQLLSRVRTTLLRTLDQNDIYRSVVETIAEVCEYSLVSIYKLEAGVLKLQACVGYQSPYLEIALDRGVNGQVARERKPVYIPDVRHSSAYLAADSNVIGQICIPLFDRTQEVIGTLSIEAYEQQPLTEHDFKMCQDVAEMVMLAVEQTRLFNSETRRLQQLAALNQLARGLISSYEVQEIVQRAVGPIRRKLGFYNLSIGIIQGDTLRFTGETVDAVGQPMPYTTTMSLQEKSLTSYSARHGEMVVVPDVTVDPRFMPGHYVPKTLSEVVVPLRDGKQVLGTLNVESDRKHAFEDDDVITIKTLADQISVALVNAMHFQNLRQKNEEVARSNAALAEAGRLKDEFLANISHELRTPLNSIMGYIEMIRSEFYGPIPGSFSDPLERVERNSHRLLRLINDVLDISKIEAGREKLQLEKFLLPELVRYSCESVRPQAEENSLQLNYTIAPDAPRWVVNDVRRITQVVSNLLSNAVKFTPQGSVEVTVTPHKLPNAEDGFCIKVKDTGIGIPASEFENIFDSFRQVDGSATRNFGGTGLGLALCRKLVHMMRGTITVESQLEHGSTFTVMLPVAVDPNLL